MNIGFDQPLYVQPFDHRGSFQTKMFGWKGNLSEAQTAEIAATNQVIYDGFDAAILRAAATEGFITAAPAEKSGQDDLFEKASAKR